MRSLLRWSRFFCSRNTNGARKCVLNMSLIMEWWRKMCLKYVCFVSYVNMSVLQVWRPHGRKEYRLFYRALLQKRPIILTWAKSCGLCAHFAHTPHTCEKETYLMCKRDLCHMWKRPISRVNEFEKLWVLRPFCTHSTCPMPCVKETHFMCKRDLFYV